MRKLSVQVYYKRNRREVLADVFWSYHPFTGLKVQVIYDDHDITNSIPSYQLEAIRHECNKLASMITMEEREAMIIPKFVSTVS